MECLLKLLRLKREPDFVIGSPDDPYLLRWFIIPRNRWLNIYLHKFMRDDDDRALHDHPWTFISLVISGMYWEQTERGGKVRYPWSIAFRKATHRHRVALFRQGGRILPCWTIVITGPKVREWGFWCPQGFVPWRKFVSPNNRGEVGPGCGE